VPLRLLLLNWRDLQHPEAGGAEKYLVEIAEGLAARGHDVTFRTSWYPGSLHNETVNGVHYVRRGGKYTIYPRALAAQLGRRHRADIVVDVQNGVPYLTPLIRRGPVVNLVHHVHREQWPVIFPGRVASVGWWLESRLAPRIYRRQQYVAVSDATRRELGGLGITPERVDIIHNGTDLVSLDGIEKTAHPSIVVLGRLVPQKRVDLAIEATGRLREIFPDLTLTIAGTGWWEPQLRDLVEELDLVDRVHFAGHVSQEEKHQLLARSWVQALPSLKEGWGLVIVEAGIHGTPTVAFREAGGTADAIRDGETGILTDEGLEAFTEGLASLLGDDALRHDMGTQAAEWARRFSWGQAIDRWEELLSRAVRR
jgi:glycosyltransferase involved in cell wall biosynthesis